MSATAMLGVVEDSAKDFMNKLIGVGGTAFEKLLNEVGSALSANPERPQSVTQETLNRMTQIWMGINRALAAGNADKAEMLEKDMAGILQSYKLAAESAAIRFQMETWREILGVAKGVVKSLGARILPQIGDTVEGIGSSILGRLKDFGYGKATVVEYAKTMAAPVAVAVEAPAAEPEPTEPKSLPAPETNLTPEGGGESESEGGGESEGDPAPEENQ